eukprot:SAG31_NODE_49_length_30599_cov_15.615016_2_plen_102_part_00
MTNDILLTGPWAKLDEQAIRDCTNAAVKNLRELGIQVPIAPELSKVHHARSRLGGVRTQCCDRLCWTRLTDIRWTHFVAGPRLLVGSRCILQCNLLLAAEQ